MRIRFQAVGVIVGSLAVAIVCVAAQAQAKDGAAIAFVDVRKAVFGSKEGRAAQQEFSRAEESKLEELRPLRDELGRLQEEFERQKFVLSEEALGARQLELMKKKRDLERDIREAEEDLQLEQIKLLQPIEKKLKDAVARVGKERGFSMIVDKSTAGILYYESSLDITDVVVKELNEGN